MKIEIWSDYACPFCYIGEKRLQRALAEVGDKNITVEFKSFELDPTASNEVTFTNTFDALRLTKFAQERGHNDIITKLFDAYFTKNLELSNHAVLKKIAAECGLDGEEVEEVLSGERYVEAVHEDELQAARLGIQAVPYFVVGGKYGLSGAQSPDVLKRAITEALTEESFNGMTCGADGCHFDD